VLSVSKTVTSLAVGMLVGDGALSLDDPVLAHLPELADTAAAGSEAMTVGHLRRMTAGNGYRWAEDDADHPGDPARDFLAAPLVAEPGSSYHYAGGNTYVLGRVVHAISGLDLRDFLVPRLLGPLGIRNPQWLRCPLGFPLGAIGLQLRTSEITRIAQLLLHEGTCDRRRLVRQPDFVIFMFGLVFGSGWSWRGAGGVGAMLTTAVGAGWFGRLVGQDVEQVADLAAGQRDHAVGRRLAGALGGGPGRPGTRWRAWSGSSSGARSSSGGPGAGPGRPALFRPGKFPRQRVLLADFSDHDN
jgi:CubicO group peptidase (beta-lactamase class C family)